MNRVWPFYIILFFSGFSALIYEISWNRQIGLLFGHTAQSSGIVITIYFLGMALGYWWASRTIDTKTSPLRYYAIAEIIAGVWSFFTPIFLQNTSSSSVLFWINYPDLFMRIIFRITLTLLLLLPTATALGYSFPAFAKFIAMQKEDPNKSIITSYAWNTVGAFFGVFLTGSIFFYYLGITGTHYLAAIISILCGLIAIILPFQMKTNTDNIHTSLDKNTPIHPFIYWLAILSGFSILGLEVLYTHLFSLISYNSTYNFSATLCSFLISLSLGSFIVTHIKKRRKHYFVWLCLLVSCAIPISLQIFNLTTKVELFEATNNFTIYLVSYFLCNLFIVILPITTAAMILPLCWHSLTTMHAKNIGFLTFINTIFAAIGSVTATFVMIPYFGLHNSFIFFALLYCSASIVLLFYFFKMEDTMLEIPICIIIVAMCILFPKTGQYQRQNHEQIWYQETFYGPIEVIREKSTNNLKITQNYHYVLGSSLAEVREKRQAHIPLILHPFPQKIAFLGMGTGMTAKGALEHPEVQRIDIVELIPEVVEAAKFFHKEQNNIFTDERVQIIINDARHHLSQKNNKYDVIISDLFIPWHSYTGYLYTKEHYQIAIDSLQPEGLFCQWLPLYQLGENEFEIIANTFSSIFKNVQLWRGEDNNNSPLLALIGSKSQNHFDILNIKPRLDQLSTPKPIKVNLQQGSVRILMPEDKLLHFESFFSLYIGKWQLQKDRPLNTDNFPYIELLAPITENQKACLQNMKLLQYYKDVFEKLPNK